MEFIDNLINYIISIKDVLICTSIMPFLFLLTLFFARVMFYGKKHIKSNFLEKILLYDLKYKRSGKYCVPKSVFVANLVTLISIGLIYIGTILHIILFCQATSIIYKIMLIIYFISCFVYMSIIYHYKLEEDRREKRIHRHK